MVMMMTDAVEITIREWANDWDIYLTENQIEELVDGIEIARQMSLPCGYGIDRYRHEENVEIQRLKNQIDMLRRYLDHKGLHCILYDDKIVRPYMVGRGEYAVTEQEEFR
jgi:hypothetical protein